MKKNNKKLIIVAILLSIFSISFIISYGFYEFEDKTNELVMQSGIVNMTMTDSGALNLTSQYPMEYDDVLVLEDDDDSTNDHLINFTLTANNESSDTFYYSLQVVEGEEITGKVRIDPEYISFDLYENISGTDYYYLRNVKLSDYLGINIVANKIEGSSTLNRQFYLRAWVNDDLIVGNTSQSKISLTDFNNSYANISVKIDCDNTEKETPFSYIAKASKRNDVGYIYGGDESTKLKSEIRDVVNTMYADSHKSYYLIDGMDNDETNRRPHFFFANYKFFKDKFPSTTTINFKQVSSAVIDNYFNNKIKANDLAPDYSETNGTLDSNDTSDTADFFDHTDYNYDGHRTIGYFTQTGVDEFSNPIYEYNIVSDGLIMFPEDASNMFNLDIIEYTSSGASTTIKDYDSLTYHNDSDSNNAYTIDCLENIEYINFDNVYTGNTTNFGYLFMDLQNLKEIDLSKLDTHNGVNMAGVFCWCKSLTELDVNYLDLSRATNIGWIFAGLNLAISEDGTVDDFCGGLQNLDVHRVTTITDIFTNSLNIERLDLRNWYTGTLEYFGAYYVSSSYPCNISQYIAYVVDSDNTVLETYYTGPIMGQHASYYSSSSDIVNLKYLDISNFDVSNLTSLIGTFYHYDGLKTLKIDNWDTSNCTNFSSMFERCRNLVNFDTTSLEVTNKALYISDLFYECESLTTIDVSYWDTSNVIKMSNVFDNCKLVTTLNVSNWDTSKANTMFGLFSGCSSLTNLIGVNNLNTSLATILSSMFTSCSSLTTLDISNWDYSNCTSLDYMFTSCTNLTSIKLGTMNVSSSLTTMQNSFYGCTNLTDLDFSNVTGDFSGVTIFKNTFYGCSNLEILDLTNVLTYSSSYNSRELFGTFQGCTSLITIYVNSNYNGCKLSGNTFYQCTSLIGGNGTRYNAININSAYAKIDTAEVLDTDGVTVLTAAVPGYFSVKSSS